MNFELIQYTCPAGSTAKQRPPQGGAATGQMRGHQFGQVPRILRAKSILESGATTTHSQAAVTT